MNECPSINNKCHSLQIACSLGHLDCVKRQILIENKTIETHAIVYALDENHFDCAIFCLQNRDKSVELYPSLSQMIILRNNTELLKAAVESDISFSARDLMLMLEYNNLEAFKIMKNAGYNFHSVKNNKIRVIEDENTEFYFEGFLNIAIQTHLDVEIIKLLVDDGVKVEEDSLELCCYYENFSIFEYLLSIGAQCRNLHNLVRVNTFKYIEMYLRKLWFDNKFNTLMKEYTSKTIIKCISKIFEVEYVYNLDLYYQIGIRKFIQFCMKEFNSIKSEPEIDKTMNEFDGELKKLAEEIELITMINKDVLKYEIVKYI